MLTSPMDVLREFPAGKSKKQKQAFRDAVQSYARSLGYPVTEEQGSFGRRNLVIGDPEKASCLVAAAEAPSGAAVLLEIVRILPRNQRQKACFVLLDGKRSGAKAYREHHPQTAQDQIVLLLEEVSSGDQIRMIPTKALMEDRKRLTSLYAACGYFGKKSLLVEEKKPGVLPGLQRKFPYAVTVRTVDPQKRKRKPIPPEETNINILRAALTTYICCGAAQ